MEQDYGGGTCFGRDVGVSEKYMATNTQDVYLVLLNIVINLSQVGKCYSKYDEYKYVLVLIYNSLLTQYSTKMFEVLSSWELGYM